MKNENESEKVNNSPIFGRSLRQQTTSLVRHVPPFAKTGVFVSLASLMSLQRHQKCQRRTGHFPDVNQKHIYNKFNF